MTNKQAVRLLIIDDDAHMREGLAEVLELDGFECHQAGTAGEGLEKALRSNPAVVIMDIQLPDSSGFQLCAGLRKHSKEIILVLMSGRFLSSEEKTQGFELGADEYITKPFDPRELTARIHQLMTRGARG